ncbi:E3 ubiquitin-protein ligase RFI2-like isoform X1 [Phragmites australis]|uniref:E3 ubiquitin-protein ligase RFI2-like isoform X1 n=1 Tax=Phragmites australis TaxID=29695 RepID=UPI002D768387|nr:E3 ubiquitin-protein ligase RFI2-like isoform X1 [Phragmites australis]
MSRRAMDLNTAPPPPEACSICLDPVVTRAGARSVVTLQCGHEFHLDCIGSAFNAKGAMQCPNCRKIEKGHWLYANGRQPSSDSDLGSWVTSEIYDIISDLLRRSPFDGSTLLAFQDHEPEPTSFEDRSNSEHMPFYLLRPTGMESHATADLNNVQVFDRTEPRNYEIEHQYLDNLPMLGIPNHPTAPFGIGVPRYDGRNQQSSRQYMHSHPLLDWPTPQSGSSFIAPIGSSPPVTPEARSHGHGMRSHVFQQTVPSNTPISPYFPTARRVRPSALSIASFIAASYEAEARRPHDISLTGAANTQNSNLPNDNEAFDREAI